jgi:hypothetical protein
MSDEKKPPLRKAAAMLGAKGGHARKRALSPERRTAIARNAITTRWRRIREANAEAPPAELLCAICIAEGDPRPAPSIRWPDGGSPICLRCLDRAMTAPKEPTPPDNVAANDSASIMARYGTRLALSGGTDPMSIALIVRTSRDAVH